MNKALIVLLAGILIALSVFTYGIYQPKPEQASTPAPSPSEPIIIVVPDPTPTPEPEPKALALPELEIEQWVKCYTYAGWKKTVEAKRGGILEFKVKISSIGEGVAENVWIKLILPPEIIYRKDSLKINGDYSDDCLNRIFLGDLSPDQSKLIRFRGKLCYSKSQYHCGDNEFSVRVKTWADEVDQRQGRVTVYVHRYCYKPCYYYRYYDYCPYHPTVRPPTPCPSPSPPPIPLCPPGGPGGDPP